MMLYGFVMPVGAASDIAKHAVTAELSDWDAIFDWEAVWGDDAWIALTAAAMVTDRIRLGTMLTPVPRVRPWDLAWRVSSLDRLSGGRVIVGPDSEPYTRAGPNSEADEGRKVRVEKTDEGLAIYAGLMAGQPFSFRGKHYTVKPTAFMLPAPTVQQPHPPVWVVGASKGGATRQPSLEWAARWQGWLPQVVDGDSRGSPRSPEELFGLTYQVRRMREDAGLSMEHFDICVEGEFYGTGHVERDIAAWADAGATWWIEGAWGLEDNQTGRAELQRRIQAGPPDTP